MDNGIMMGFLTNQEKEILTLLKTGCSTKDIGKQLKISPTSVSRSIKNIRIKAVDFEEDIEFMLSIGYLQIKGNKFQFISKDRNPTALRKKSD
jgi:predicted transcriptional regulator